MTAALTMHASAQGETEWTGEVLVASVVLHALVFLWVPSATRTHAASPASVIEIVESPRVPAPPPPTQETPPEATRPRAPWAPGTHVGAHRVAVRAALPETASAESGSEAIDFTDTTPPAEGLAVSVTGDGPETSRAASPAQAPNATSRARAAVRPPQPPALDAELERQYPAARRDEGTSGSATIRVSILPDGRAVRTRVVSESAPGFGDACAATVRAARWQPARDERGTAVGMDITFTCRFEVNR